MAKTPQTVVEAAGREVVITNPDKVFFPQAGCTKLDLAKYYLAVAAGALRGIAARPLVLKRYVDGADHEPFFQKRAPRQHPEWVETVELRFPSGRTAREIVVRDAAQLLWIMNLGCIDLNPHPVRADDLDHPDELRIDLDPGPGVRWEAVKHVALVVRDVLNEYGLRGWPKTSGTRGIHVNVRIERRWSFDQVRCAALALAREVERRAPGQATSKWWKEERRGVFLDYNQNAKDRTVASAWSVRATPDARVSMPLEWDEVADCDPTAFTLVTAPARLAKRGDPSVGIDAAAGSLDKVLELSAAQEAAGLGDAPWPPHYKKQADEPPRVAPSRRKAPSAREKGSGRRKSTQPLITVAKAEHKEDALAGLDRWKARHPEAAALLQVDDILMDSMRGRSSTWTRVRINLRHVPEGKRPAEEPPDPDYDPWRRFRSGPRASRAEHTLQLVGGSDLQLIVAAVLRALVGTPAHELRGMPEARPLQVVVGDFADADGPQRLPAQVLASIPAARRAGEALSLRVRLRLRLGPVAPRVAFKRMLTQRRQLGDELLALRIGKRRGDSDVVQRALVVVEAEQERSDHRARSPLVPAETGDHAVGGAPVFDLDHRALAGSVGCVQTLRYDAVEPGALETTEPVFGHGAIAGGRREVNRRRCTGQHLLQPFAPYCERYVAQVLVAQRQQVPGDEGSRHLRGQELHPRRGRMDAQEQRLEVETAGAHDHDLAIHNVALG